MKTFVLVWGFIAFSILGFEFLNKTETFQFIQDFESNFEIVSYPEEFLSNWSANEIRSGSSRIFQAIGEGVNGSKALGIQTIGSFDAQIYIKTSTIGLQNNRISFKAKTRQNGSGTRPVYIFCSFSIDNGENFASRLQIGESNSFPNENTEYLEYEFFFPEGFMEQSNVMLKLEVVYGEGSGSAARLFLDDFIFHGMDQGEGPDGPDESIEPLLINTVQVTDETTLKFEFNRPLVIHASDPIESIRMNREYGNPKAVLTDGKDLVLEFSDYIFPNRYQLQIDGIKGEELEEPRDITYDFEIKTAVPHGTIIINELMVDPNPKALVPGNPVLPNTASDEYIELFNRSGKSIWLAGFTYNGGVFEDFTLEPNSYLLLTAVSKKELFDGDIAGVQPFRALPNNSGAVHIQDALGNTVDSLEYQTSWYRNNQKAQGGWSLERINPFQICSDENNWIASTALEGGTPGKINAVYSELPDDRPFTVTGILAKSETEITVVFSKPIREENILAAEFRMDNEIPVFQKTEGQSVHFLLQNPLESGLSYVLEIKNLSDCFGILLEEEVFSFHYDTEAPYVQRIAVLALEEIKLYFNEALDKASAENPANYQIQNLPNSIKSAALTDSVTVEIQLNQLLEIDNTYTLTAQQVSDIFGNGMESQEIEFSVIDHLDTVLWIGPTLLGLQFNTEVDEISASMTSNYFVSPNIGQPNSAFRDSDDAKTVHLVFDRELPVNNPGTIYTQNIKDTDGNYINTLKKTFLQDNRALAVSDLHIKSDSTLLITFNKDLEPTFAGIKSLYSVNNGIGSPYEIDPITSRQFLLSFHPKFENGVSYQISVHGLRDIFGISMNRTINVTFVFDQRPPEIVEASILNPFAIKITVNKPVLAPEVVVVDEQEVLSISQTSDDTFVITTKTALEKTVILITVPELTDHMGNMAEDVEVGIDNTTLKLGGGFVLDASRVLLTFSTFLDPSSSIFPEKYKINGEQPATVELSENAFEILLVLSNPLVLGDSLLLEIHDVKGINRKESGEVITGLLYEDGINDLLIIGPQILEIHHTGPLEYLDTGTTDFSVLDHDQNIQAILNQSNPEIMQLVLSVPLEEGINYTLQIPTRWQNGVPWYSGSFRNVEWDNSPPGLTAIEAYTEKELLLHFDEPLDPIMAMITAFYELEGQNPTEVIFTDMPNQVILVWKDPLQEGKAYELTVSNLEDLHRNRMMTERFAFVFEKPSNPLFREIVINEVMAAPRDGNTLPNVEYVELFNTTDQDFFLGGFSLSNSRSSTNLPREYLKAGEYLILCPNNHKGLFEAYGKTIGLSNWPVLLNDGDEVHLRDRNGATLDSFYYTTASYGGSSIAQGGYSLEIINPFHPCQMSDNIRPSESPQRGTPGKPNSVFDDSPDRRLPQLLNAKPEDGNSILLTFDRPAHSNYANAEYSISPSVSITEVAIHPENEYQIILHLYEPLKENQAYLLKVEDWRDCAGNLIDPGKNHIEFKIPGKAEEGDILLNEVLFNAKTGGPKFVEIYNRSNKYLNLKNWKLANFANDEISNRRIISSNDLILEPFSFLVLTTDSQRLQQDYPRGKLENFWQMASLPSYPIASGNVIFMDPEEQWIERLDYSEKYHHDWLREVRGISLERFSLEDPVNESKNWHSASANEGFATPGYKNSQTYAGGNLEKGIHIDPLVFIPEAPGEQNFTTISYRMDQPGFMATLRIYAVNGQLVKELCQSEVWGSSGFYIWNGTNEKGAKVRPGYYILWVETIHPNGTMERIRKTVVVGTKF